MALLDKVKLALRQDSTDLDEDIQDTIDAAIADMILCGVLSEKVVETDPLIVRAVKVFCQWEYAGDFMEADRYKKSYEMLRNHLTLSSDYTASVTEVI